MRGEFQPSQRATSETFPRRQMGDESASLHHVAHLQAVGGDGGRSRK